MAQPTSRAQLLLAEINRWNQQHPQQQIDPQAELAVASREGLSGGIGDNGHAFGPNQLNNAGGVLTGKFAGMSPGQINQWAWSPAGIQYALAGVAGAAGGERGGQAVRDIVNRFERPAKPGQEIAAALQAYGGKASSGSPLAVAAANVMPPVASADLFAPVRRALAAAVTSGSLDRTSFYNTLGAALRKQQAGLNVRPLPSPNNAAVPMQPLPASKGLSLAAVPLGLATRQGIQLDSTVLPQADQIAQRFGVKINSGYRASDHNAQVGGAPNSDHLRGDAVDYSGTPQQLAALYRWAAQQQFPYLEPLSQSGNHVHISLRR